MFTLIIINNNNEYASTTYSAHTSDRIMTASQWYRTANGTML